MIPSEKKTQARFLIDKNIVEKMCLAMEYCGYWLLARKRQLFTHFSADTLSEDEDDAAMSGGDGLCISESTQYSTCDSDFVPTPGGPFSALTPSMWPQDILHRLSNPVRIV